VVSILVPPAYHYTVGVRMTMGKVAAIRKRSPADGQVQEGDTIFKVRLLYNGRVDRTLSEKELDPVRLPFDLDRHIHADPKRKLANWQIRLRVKRLVDHNAGSEIELPPIAWDDSWKLGEEGPNSPAAPMSIPQLGIAYHVESRVAHVEPGSPAAEAGIQQDDVFFKIRFRRPGKTPSDKKSWSDWIEMQSKRGSEKPYDQWAFYSDYLDFLDFPTMQVRVQRGGKDLPELFELKAELDTSWPALRRGWILEPDTRLQKANGFLEAVGLGLSETWQFIEDIYVSAIRIVSRDVSTKTLGGPIEIASTGFSVAGDDLFRFFLFLGIISINLAVVNFLPIPVLDGGHMVFLLYEWVAGRPPPEIVRIVATYVGLAFIVLLMLFVVGLDLQKRGWLPW